MGKATGQSKNLRGKIGQMIYYQRKDGTTVVYEAREKAATPVCSRSVGICRHRPSAFISSAYVLQPELYSKLSQSKVITEAALRSGISKGAINAAGTPSAR